MRKVRPADIEGLSDAYEKIDNLGKQTKGIKIAAWVTAISTTVLAIVGVVTLIANLL